MENKEREKETEEGDGGGRWERAEEEETTKKRAVDSLQVLLRARPRPTVEHRAPDWRVRGMERIHGRLKSLSTPDTTTKRATDLEIQLPEVIEEHLDPVVVLRLVQDDKLHVWFS